jgi:hypothetical protein
LGRWSENSNAIDVWKNDRRALVNRSLNCPAVGITEYLLSRRTIRGVALSSTDLCHRELSCETNYSRGILSPGSIAYG